MRSAIAVALSAITMLATMTIALAESDGMSSRQHGTKTLAPATKLGKDSKADDASDIITLEKGIATPYRACINARGWVNGRLVCAD